jgi:hypothetical protein
VVIAMTNPFSDLDYMAVKDQQKLVNDAVRNIQMTLMQLRLDLSNGLDVSARAQIENELRCAESDIIGGINDNVEAQLAARISDIREEDACDDYRAETRHMTAAYPNTRASI